MRALAATVLRRWKRFELFPVLNREFFTLLMHGQLVMGAPGAGKSTYCNGMSQLLDELGRPYVLVNLDPANEFQPYRSDIDIRELIRVDEVMSRLHLGPNGALLYCMRTLEQNIEWLFRRLQKYDGYLLVDLPGQLELYNGDDCIKNIIRKLDMKGHRLTAVHLSDCLYCSDPGKYIAVTLSALSIMVNLECPQINLLSKFDLALPDLPFDIDFFLNIPDIKQLLQLLQDNELLMPYKGLNDSICSVISDFDLVKFTGVDVTSKKRMMEVLKLADTANGYALLEADLRNIIVS
ncbi:hypothetical protein AB6A40_005411 [Gnathostoma spinigerum]|uniref:GPN-loop GTPase 2 n=1 Tax=Gnathostoma spinigerum TaxID=75299 RepID=A0ABD6EHK6_9BILA